MSFVIKQEYVPPHVCGLPDLAQPVPGDMWKCESGHHWVFRFYSGMRWSAVTPRQAKKILKRYEAGKKFTPRSKTRGPQ